MSAHGSPALVEWDAAQEQATPGELATLLEDVDGVPRWRWWLECQDAPAMLRWAAARVDRRVLVLATCDCAETVLHLVPEGENRPHIAVAAARAWCRGDATLEDVRAAYAAASALHQRASTATVIPSCHAAPRFSPRCVLSSCAERGRLRK